MRSRMKDRDPERGKTKREKSRVRDQAGRRGRDLEGVGLPWPQEQPRSQSSGTEWVPPSAGQVTELERKLAGGCDSIWSLELWGVRVPHPMGVRVTGTREKCPRRCPQ